VLERHKHLDKVALVPDVGFVLRVVRDTDEVNVLVHCVFDLFLSWLKCKSEKTVETRVLGLNILLLNLLIEDLLLLD